MKVKLTGNSHSVAIHNAYREQKLDIGWEYFPFGGAAWETVPFSTIGEDGLVHFYEREYAIYVATLPGDLIFSHDLMWVLVCGTHTPRIYNHAFWFNSSPSHVAGEGARPVSEGLLDQIIDADLLHIRNFLSQMSATATPCVVVAAPPPRRDHPVFRYGVSKETVLAVDGRLRHRFRAMLEAFGLDFIEPPAEAFGDDGFLKAGLECLETHGRPDPHHANDIYGAMMLDKIRRYLDKRAATDAVASSDASPAA